MFDCTTNNCYDKLILEMCLLYKMLSPITSLCFDGHKNVAHFKGSVFARHPDPIVTIDAHQINYQNQFNRTNI